MEALLQVAIQVPAIGVMGFVFLKVFQALLDMHGQKNDRMVDEQIRSTEVQLDLQREIARLTNAQEDHNRKYERVAKELERLRNA